MSSRNQRSHPDAHSFAAFSSLIDSDGDDRESKQTEKEMRAERQERKALADEAKAAKANKALQKQQQQDEAKKKKAEPKKGSASDWYEQLISKMSTTATTPAASATTDSATTIEVKPVLLSERVDLWDAAADAAKLKKQQQKAASQTSAFKRRMDEKLARMEAQDVEKDDFLGNLMKGHTGDAFDDLIPQILEEKKKNKKQKIDAKATAKATATTLSKATKDNKDDNTLVQLPPPAPAKPRYQSDPTIVGTSKTYENYAASLPPHHATPEYQKEIKRMIAEYNKTGKYTPPAPPKSEIEEEEEDHEDDEEVEKEEQPKFSMLLKPMTDTQRALLDANNENEEDTDIEDQDDVDDDSDDISDNDDSDDSDDDSDGIPAIPAQITHQALILDTYEQKIDALKEYHSNIVQSEASCRLKSKIVIIVRDGKTANQMLPRIGLKITKHKKSNRGMSNAGVSVHTKGVEMIHERLNEAQRAKALKYFKTGAVNTMITTDDYLAQLWPFRNQIGYIIHYDVPIFDATNGGKIPTVNAGLTKEQIANKLKQEAKHTHINTITKMSERLSFLQRTQNMFPDMYYKITEERIDLTKKNDTNNNNNNNDDSEQDEDDEDNNNNKFNVAAALLDVKNKKKKVKTFKIIRHKELKPNTPLKNTSLVFLTKKTKHCKSFANSMAPIYESEYGAVKTAAALKEFANSL